MFVEKTLFINDRLGKKRKRKSSVKEKAKQLTVIDLSFIFIHWKAASGLGSKYAVMLAPDIPPPLHQLEQVQYEHVIDRIAKTCQQIHMWRREKLRERASLSQEPAPSAHMLP